MPAMTDRALANSTRPMPSRSARWRRTMPILRQLLVAPRGADDDPGAARRQGDHHGDGELRTTHVRTGARLVAGEPEHGRAGRRSARRPVRVQRHPRHRRAKAPLCGAGRSSWCSASRWSGSRSPAVPMLRWRGRSAFRLPPVKAARRRRTADASMSDSISRSLREVVRLVGRFERARRGDRPARPRATRSPHGREGRRRPTAWIKLTTTSGRSRRRQTSSTRSARSAEGPHNMARIAKLRRGGQQDPRHPQSAWASSTILFSLATFDLAPDSRRDPRPFAGLVGQSGVEVAQRAIDRGKVRKRELAMMQQQPDPLRYQRANVRRSVYTSPACRVHRPVELASSTRVRSEADPAHPPASLRRRSSTGTARRFRR